MLDRARRGALAPGKRRPPIAPADCAAAPAAPRTAVRTGGYASEVQTDDWAGLRPALSAGVRSGADCSGGVASATPGTLPRLRSPACCPAGCPRRCGSRTDRGDGGGPEIRQTQGPADNVWTGSEIDRDGPGSMLELTSATSPRRSRDVRSREDESDRADRGNRT